MSFPILFTPLRHWSYNQHFLCVIFPPDAAVPLSVKLEREGERIGGREDGERQTWKGRQTEERETGAMKAGRESRRRRQRRAEGRGGRCTHSGRQGSRQEGVKVKTITRGAGCVRLCAAPWKCQALCSLTVSCTRRPESAGSLTKTDSSN